MMSAKLEPYGVYDKVDWEVPVGKNGDTYDRYWIRMEEMRQSARIIAQCLDQMPPGPIMADVPQYIPPPKQQVMRDMESLIHHFIIFTQGFKPPKAETYCAHRSAEGRTGIFHRQRRQPPSLSVEDSRALVHPYGRIRSYGARLLDLRHHHDLRHLRHRHGGV